MVLRKKNSKFILVITGLILITLGFSVIIYQSYSVKCIENIEEKSIEEYYITSSLGNDLESKDSNDIIKYFAILSIPKIDLKRGLVSPNSRLNDIEYNIEILKNSIMPSEKQGNMFLAAHSGNSKVSFFKELDKLKISDEVLLDYEGETYIYNVLKIYSIIKTGQLSLNLNTESKYLILITCIPNSDRQLIVECELL